MTRLPAYLLMLAILTTASIGLSTDKKPQKKDERRPEPKKVDHDHHHDDHHQRDKGHDHHRDAKRPEHRPHWGHGVQPPVHTGSHHWTTKAHHPPQTHAVASAKHGCPCDQRAVYKINNCRPALTSQGALNFMRVFEAAAAKGVENATIRAMNAAQVSPGQSGPPCVTPVLPSAGDHRQRGR